MAETALQCVECGGFLRDMLPACRCDLRAQRDALQSAMEKWEAAEERAKALSSRLDSLRQFAALAAVQGVISPEACGDLERIAGSVVEKCEHRNRIAEATENGAIWCQDCKTQVGIWKRVVERPVFLGVDMASGPDVTVARCTRCGSIQRQPLVGPLVCPNCG